RMGQAARFALLASGFVAVALATLMSAWNWIDNPSGIFQNDSGTNWSFLFDTFISWFLPTLIGLMPPAFLGHIGWQWIRSDIGSD
ncbi:MAG: hypothetical protein AAF660_15285, partial [Pseudomonadota bacterium]